MSEIECFAVFENNMTRCKCGTWDEQKDCVFADMSKYTGRCKDYLRINGGLCKNIEAQKLAYAEKK